MSASTMLRRIQYLEAQLSARDRADAARQTAAAEVAAKISTEQRAAQRETERTASEQNMRRAAWINYAIVTADPAAPFNPLAIEAAIPADATAWPPNFDKTLVVFDHTPKAKPRPSLDGTLMGQLAKGKLS
jgi:hypothetical protein